MNPIYQVSKFLFEQAYQTLYMTLYYIVVLYTYHHHIFSDVDEGLGLGGKVVTALYFTIVKQECCLVFLTTQELLLLLQDKCGKFGMGSIISNHLRSLSLLDH